MDPNQYNPRPGAVLRPNASGQGGGFAGPQVAPNPYVVAPPPPPTASVTPAMFSPTAFSPSPPVPPNPYIVTPQAPQMSQIPQAPYGPPVSSIPYNPYSFSSPPAGPTVIPPQFGPSQPPMPAGYLQPNPFASYQDPYNAERKPTPGPNKKLLMMAGGAFLLISLIVIIASASSSKQPNTASRGSTAQQSTSASLIDVVSRADGTLDLSRKAETAKVIRAQVIQANIKEQVNLSSGLSLMVKAVGDYESTTSPPAAGKKFIIVLVVAGNHAVTENLSVSYLDFKLRDGKNRLLNGHPVTQQILNNPLAAPTELKPGDQVEGRLIYEVDAAEQAWTLVHKESYQKTTDNTTFVVEGRIALNTKSEAATATPPKAP